MKNRRNFESSTLGPDTKSTPFSPAASEPEETPSIGNPPVTPQCKPIIPKNPSQSESNPSPSIPVAGQSTPVISSPPATNPPPTPPRSTMAHMNNDIKLPVFKGTGSEDPEQYGFYVKQCGMLRTLRIKM